MIEEQIKSEIEKQIDKKLLNNSLENIILNSTYHCLTFAGVAATWNSIMTPQFDIGLILNKYLIIKSFQFVPFAGGNVVDVSFSDGTTETIPINVRLWRIMELYQNALQPRLMINGMRVIFADNNAATQCYPGDLFLDNIYYRYKGIVNEFDLRAGLQLTTDFGAAPVTFQSRMHVIMECYTF